MTPEVISLADSKPRQTTIRVEPELLRKARYFLDKDGKSMNDFVVEQLEHYIATCEQAQPPRTTEACASPRHGRRR